MNDRDILSVQKPFFVGIGGIGISAIARLFLHEGKDVSGMDIAESEVTNELSRAGAHIRIVPVDSQSVHDVPPGTDAIIYTIAIDKAAPKFFASLQRLSLPLYSYPQALERISRDKFTIAVSGTHGKTTTTAMIAKILLDAGKDPTVIVGSLLRESRSNFIFGKSQYLIVEACEYRRSFLQIHPTIAVITNIDNDHLDYYGDIEDITRAFSQFVSRVPRTGYIVADVSLPHIHDALAGHPGTLCDVAGREPVRELSVPGGHNRSNALLARTVAEIIGISRASAEASLRAFSGTWRRFEYRGNTSRGARVYDDYGHHPTEIAATLAGAREAFPSKRITVVFQPHLFSRTRDHLEGFVEVLSKSDRVILTDIYPAREPFDPSISSKHIADRITQRGTDARYLSSFSEIAHTVLRETGVDDVILTMGAGETNKIADMLVGK